MKKYLIILFGILLFFTCFEPYIEPKLNVHYLDVIFIQIKKIDPSAKILLFKPENTFFDFGENKIISDYGGVDSIHRNGKVLSIIETDYGKETDTGINLSKNISTAEYFFKDNKLVKKIYSDSGGLEIKKFHYKMDFCREIITLSEKDSIKSVLVYKDKRLIKRRFFDKGDREFMLQNFTYSPIGNPEYAYTKSSESYFEKFEFNNRKRQMILARFDNEKRLQWIRYTVCNSLGLPVYEERYRKHEEGFVIRKDKYNFNDQNEIEILETAYSNNSKKLKFDFVYAKKDSLNNWKERKTLENNNLILITRRIISYDNR